MNRSHDFKRIKAGYISISWFIWFLNFIFNSTQYESHYNWAWGQWEFNMRISTTNNSPLKLHVLLTINQNALRVSPLDIWWWLLKTIKISLKILLFIWMVFILVWNQIFVKVCRLTLWPIQWWCRDIWSNDAWKSGKSWLLQRLIC